MDHKARLAGAFPIGVKYGQHRDMQEKYWPQDFANMRECGIDAIRVHAFWAPIEAREGEFDFAQYDRITRMAGEYGLKVMFTMYLMAAPEWVFHKHADSRFVSASGIVWNSNQTGDNAHGGWPGLCFDSLPFRQTAENFVKVFVKHYMGNPDVLAIDIWHEPTDEAVQTGPRATFKDSMFCYCGHSAAGFKEWLNQKYGGLEKLNEVWTRHFNTWGEVGPPRNVGTYTDWLDWKTYRLDSVADSVGWLNSVVKKYDPERSTSVHTGILEMGLPITHADDHFRLAGTTDMFGCSLYDALNEALSGLTSDLMRSACHNGAYWVGETGTGSGPIFSFFGSDPEAYHCFARPLTSAQIFKLQWSNIARGAKGIFFWAWRPDISTIETLSLGFTERNGALTDRTEGLKRFTGLFRKYRDRLASAYAPKSDLCILCNMDSMIIEELASITRNNGSAADGQLYKDFASFTGCYRLCMKNGIQPDFISKELLEQGGLAGYKVLLLPYSISICTETAAAIESYVRNGGTVISDAMLGFFTDEGWGSEVCPAAGLDAVFGVSVSADYGLVKRCDVAVGDRRYPEAGRHVSERIQVFEAAEVLGEFAGGMPAIVRNRYGKGCALYLGTMLFANAEAGGLNQTNGLFNALLTMVGYEKDKEILYAPEKAMIEVRRLIGEEDEFVFVFNHSEESCSPLIKTKTSTDGAVIELMSQRPCADISNHEMVIREELLPCEVKIFHIQKAAM
ncbi:MAG: beta-galactosidase [Clostridiales bacterium]|jgi:beta-galactosidase GanA|nr:beta-galactosidase [Clostridiales bacterium]